MSRIRLLHFLLALLLGVLTIPAVIFIDIPYYALPLPFLLIGFVTTLFFEVRMELMEKNVKILGKGSLFYLFPLSLPIALYVSLVSSEIIPVIVYGKSGVPETFYSAVVVAPVFEEYSKGLIALIMAMGTVDVNKGQNIYRSRSLLEGGGKEYAVVGAMSGLMFEVIELLGYASLSPTAEEISMQIIVRSTIPLHTFNAALFSLGVWRVISGKKMKGIIYIISPMFMHASWNYIAISELTLGPIGEAILGVSLGILLFIGIEVVVRRGGDPPPVCSTCERRHFGTCSLVEVYRMCPYCSGVVTDGKCEDCGATRITCPNCLTININGARYCVHCGIPIQGTSKIILPAKRTLRAARVLAIPWATISIMLVSLFAIAYLILPLGVLMPMIVFTYSMTTSIFVLVEWNKIHSRIIGLAYLHSSVVGIIGLGVTMLLASAIIYFSEGSSLSILMGFGAVLWFTAILILSSYVLYKISTSNYVIGVRT